ncbi:MAG: DNA adenine methylase, partial [Deinococcota bacterium]
MTPHPPLRYFGGKSLLAPWIIAHFPRHRAYCEPFGGGASVLLQKPRVSLETYNDLGGRVVNFFRVLRERPDELTSLLELTRFADLRFERAQAAKGFFPGFTGAVEVYCHSESLEAQRALGMLQAYAFYAGVG